MPHSLRHTASELPQKNSHLEACEAPIGFFSHHKPFLHLSYKNPLECLLLSHFNPGARLTLDSSVLERFAFVLQKHPRTIIRQLLTLGDNKYYRITREWGAFHITFSKKKPLLNNTPVDYTGYAMDYGLTAIQINVLGIVQIRELLGLRQLPQREIARRIGCATQSVVNALKVLRHHKLLQYKYIIADYSHPFARKWRTVYELTKASLGRIGTLRIFASQKAKRILKDRKKPTHYTETSAKESHFLVWFNKFKQKYPDSDDCSLARTLNAIKKKKKSLPTEEAIATAWETFCQNKTLKLAASVGWREAFKASLLAKEGALNDKSRYWKKLSQKRINFYWFLSHVEEIKEGKYDEKPLTLQAQGRVFGEDQSGSARKARIRRTEVPTQWFKEWLMGQTDQKDLRALLERLWGFLGGTTYENLIDPCDYVMNEQGEWTLVAPNRFHAELMDEKLRVAKKTTAYREGNHKARSRLREAYGSWLKENANNVAAEQKDGSVAREVQATTTKGEKDMGFVPGNDDEGVIPYWSDEERSATKATKDHRSRRTPLQDMEARGRESEEEILKERREQQESILSALRACTNIHPAEKALRIQTITQYGIGAYQCWFGRGKIEITGEEARYVAPSEFIGHEIERRYGVVLENYTAKGEEITVRKKKETL